MQFAVSVDLLWGVSEDVNLFNNFTWCKSTYITFYVDMSNMLHQSSPINQLKNQCQLSFASTSGLSRAEREQIFILF